MTGNEWRLVVAALVNDRTRLAYAEVVVEQAAATGATLSVAERRKALDRLAATSLIVRSDDGPRVDDSALRGLLAGPGGGQKREGRERFLRDGRIEQYPSRPGERLDLLRWVVGQVVKTGERVDEKVLNIRLREIADDAAVLRRYLVDAGLLERTRDGAVYTLSGGARVLE